MNILKNKSSFRLQSLLILAFVVVGLGAPLLVGADVGSVVSELVAHLIYYICIWPVSQVLKVELWILPIIAQYNHFGDVGGVNVGWKTLRDLSNMLFIVILLVIAFATILKVQSYGYKRLLKKLLIMAVLINFSKFIVLVLIDFSQLIMLTFINAIKDIAAGGIMTALGLANVMQSGGGSSESAATGLMGSMAATYFLGAIMLMVTVVVVLVILAVLVMRIVTLWSLIVVSPIMFLASTFPKTEKYFNEWTEKLTSNLFSGPVLAFFLWLAFTIVGNGTISEGFLTPTTKTFGAGADAPALEAGKSASPPNVINFIVGISMLMLGLQMAQQSGAAGAGFAGGMAGKLKSLPGQAFKKTGIPDAGAKVLKKYGSIVGAPLGLPKYLYQGKSGEGGAKELISKGRARIGRGQQEWAKQHEDSIFHGMVDRGGMLNVQADVNRKKRKAAITAKATEGMSAAERVRYYKSKSGSEADYLESKAAVSRGNILPKDLQMTAEDYAKKGDTKEEKNKRAERRAIKGAKAAYLVQKYKKTFEDFGDNEAKDRLLSKSGAAHDAESMNDYIDEHGFSATQRMNFQGVGAEAMKAWVKKGGGKDAGKVVDGMEEGNQQLLMDALNNAINKGNLAEEIKNGQLDSEAFTALILQSRFDSEQALETYKKLGVDGGRQEGDGPTENQQVFLSQLQKSITGKQITKIDTTSELFHDISGRANDTQYKEIIQSVPGGDAGDKIVQLVTNNMTQQGNFSPIINNAATKDKVADTDFQKYIANALAAEATKKPEDHKKTPEKIKTEFALKYLKQAHLIFTEPEELADFINKNLKKEELAQINTAALKKAAKDLEDIKKEALRDLAIDPDEK